MPKVLNIAALFLVGAVLASRPARAEEKDAPVAVAMQTFNSCRKELLEKFQAKKIDDKTFAVGAAICREKFPAATLYIECKKLALDPKKGPKANVDACKKLLLTGSPAKGNPLPVGMVNDSLILGGIGLNSEQSADSLTMPNYDCGSLQKSVQDISRAEFLGFGNHPKLFAPLTKMPLASYTKLFPAAPKNGKWPEFVLWHNQVRIYGPPEKAATMAMFPLGHCIFSAELPPPLKEIKNYYLIDTARKTITPYFGIVFLQPDPALKAPELAKKLAAIFGKGYSVFPQKNGDQMVASSAIKAFDKDGDPRDLCAADRSQKKIAIFKTKAKEKTSLDFFLVANIKNLCDYGDRVFGRYSSL